MSQRSQQAAAWHGLATNRAYPEAERLACALKALAAYEAEVEAYRDAVANLRHALANGGKVGIEDAEDALLKLEAS